MNFRDQSDDALLESIADGDAWAGEALVQRHLSSIFDFCLRLTLDSRLAAEASRAVFREVLSRPLDGPPTMSPRVWLFALAREAGLDGLRERPRTGDESSALSATDPRLLRIASGSALAGDPDLALWAWQAARGQRPRDYSLLDLSVRRGLSPEEVAEAASMSRSGIFSVLGRLRGSFEEAFTASLLYNRGSEACGELARLLEDDQPLTPSLRREVSRHGEACQACRRTRSAYPSPADLLAELLEVEAALDLASSIVSQSAAAAGALATGAAPQGVQPSLEDDISSMPLIAAFGRDDAPPEVLDEIEPDDEAASLGPAHDPDAEDLTPPPEEVEYEVSDEVAQDPDWPVQPEDAEPPVGAGPVAASGYERLLSQRDRYLGRSGPPRRPRGPRLGGASGGRDRFRIGFAVLVGLLTVAAVYVGLAFGSSIQGGGAATSSGALVLPTGTPGIQEIACGSGPIAVEQGSSTALTFDASVLPGYQLTEISVHPISPLAAVERVQARKENAMRVAVSVSPAASVTAREDEYGLRVLFNRDDERVVSECRLIVRVPATTPTPTSTPVPPTATPTIQPTPQPTVAPTATPTPPPPTPTETSTPTVTPTSTPTRTPTPTMVPETP
jgi:DNA-directed RNA polymerase specialized sigma24 family protein